MRLSVVYGVSIAVHLGVAGVVWSLKTPVAKERVGVTIREVKKAAPKPQPPEPPPPVKKASAPRKVATAAARPAPAPARAAAPAAAAAAPVADFGLTMASGGDGPALAGATPAVDRPAAKKEEARPARPKVLAAAGAEEDDACPEVPVKPKPITVLQPAYTDDARGAQIEGKVRVELTVAATAR